MLILVFNLLKKNSSKFFLDKSKTPLEVLCEKFEGASLDTKHLSTHWLNPKLLRLVIENLIPFDIVEDKFNNFTAIRFCYFYYFLSFFLLKKSFGTTL